MIKHVVSWEFAEDNKTENLKNMKALLEELPALIPVIEGYEVGLNIKDSDLAMDMVLISSFADEASMQQYATHPEHRRVVEALHGVTTKAVIVDYKLQIINGCGWKPCIEHRFKNPRLRAGVFKFAKCFKVF